MSLKVNFASISRTNDVNGVLTFLIGFKKLNKSFINNDIQVNHLFLFKPNTVVKTFYKSKNKINKFSNIKNTLYKSYFGQLAIFIYVYVFRSIYLSFKINKYYTNDNSNELLFYNDIFVAFFTNLFLNKKINKIILLHTSEDPLKQLYILFPVLNFKLNKFLLNFILNSALKNSKAIITLSKKLKNKLELKYNNIHTIYNTCFIEDDKANIEKPAENNKIYNILSIGSLQHRKGFDLLINALGNLDQEFKNKLRIYIAGEGEDRSFLENLITKKNLQKNVFLLGSVKNVSELLIENDIFFMPSRDEGLSIALIEAMYLGKPIFTTRVGSVVELLNENECVYVDTNIVDIERCLNLIAKNNYNLIKLSTISKQTYTNKLSNKIFVNNYSRVFKSVVNA